MADCDDSAWQRKGATLSDKTARKEYGLTQGEIVGAIQNGHLQCRQGSVHGNPYLRLLRQEVEALVAMERGSDHLRGQQARTELAQINRELKRLEKQIAALEARKKILASGAD